MKRKIIFSTVVFVLTVMTSFAFLSIKTSDAKVAKAGICDYIAGGKVYTCSGKFGTCHRGTDERWTTYRINCYESAYTSY